MKWSDLTLKERKQIYDAVRAENPNASYFDIKSQFDSIPEYEDGGKKIMPPKELGLTPGTPEYYKRQRQISGKAELVQPEAYVTPVGYIKDAITTAEELEKGNYGNAAKNKKKVKEESDYDSEFSDMLHLKRALVNEGKIHDWSSKVNQNTIEDFLFDPRNTGVVNNANKLQYNMYRNKSRFVDRINNLTPMEFITPLLLPVAGYETNKE